MKKLRWFSELLILIVISLPLAILPLEIALKAGRLIGSVLYLVWGSRRKIAVDNARRSVECGALKTDETPVSIARGSFANLGESIAETVKIYYGLGDSIVRNVEVTGIENLLQAKARNKGVLVITGHCCNWELSALAFGVKINPCVGVAREQNNPYINRIIEKVRTRYGNAAIYKKGALKKILAALKRGDVIGILMDQAVIPGEGYVIDFLGRDAWTIKAPALIARKTGAPVLSAFLHRSGGKHILDIQPEIRLSGAEDTEQALIEDTKNFSARIEDHIRQYPADWLWIHRRWKRTGQ